MERLHIAFLSVGTSLGSSYWRVDISLSASTFPYFCLYHSVGSKTLPSPFMYTSYPRAHCPSIATYIFFPPYSGLVLVSASWQVRSFKYTSGFNHFRVRGAMFRDIHNLVSEAIISISRISISLITQDLYRFFHSSSAIASSTCHSCSCHFVHGVDSGVLTSRQWFTRWVSFLSTTTAAPVLLFPPRITTF